MTSINRANWVKGQVLRTAVLVQFDKDKNIDKINYIQQIPTKEYYANHATDLYYDSLIGCEYVYNVYDELVGKFCRHSFLTRTTWEPDSNGIYPGDSIPEVVIPGHEGGGGSNIFPENPDGNENDTTSCSNNCCDVCFCMLEYDNATEQYFCPICEGNFSSGGSTSGGGGGGGGSNNSPDPPINPNLKNKFSVKGYHPGYEKFPKEDEIPPGFIRRFFDPKSDFDQHMTFAKCTPDLVIGQSQVGCVAACINHLLLSFGERVTNELNVWNTYYDNVFSKNNPNNSSLNDVMKNGVYGTDTEALLNNYFDLGTIETKNQVSEAIDRGNPLFVVYLKDESGDIAQSHSEIIYGYGANKKFFVAFDSSCQNYIVWDADNLLYYTSYLYEIKGRK